WELPGRSLKSTNPRPPVPGPYEVVGESRELVMKVLRIREVRLQAEDRRRRGRIDVHEARVGKRTFVGRAQRPVAVGPLVDADARKRVPLAEEDAIAAMPLGIDDVEDGDPRQLGGERHE